MQNHIPVLALAGLGGLAIIGAVVLGVAGVDNPGLQTALISIAVGAVGAIAGLVRGQPTSPASRAPTLVEREEPRVRREGHKP